MQISSIPAIGLKNINSAAKVLNANHNNPACQPLKKAHPYEFAMPFKAVHKNQDGDCAELSNVKNLEEKYDFACRLAAYYRNQYLDLKSKGSVEA